MDIHIIFVANDMTAVDINDYLDIAIDFDVHVNVGVVRSKSLDHQINVGVDVTVVVVDDVHV